MHALMHTHTHTHTYARMHAHMHARTRAHTHTHTPSHTHTHTHTHTLHVHMYACTHIHFLVLIKVHMKLPVIFVVCVCVCVHTLCVCVCVLCVYFIYVLVPNSWFCFCYSVWDKHWSRGKSRCQCCSVMESTVLAALWRTRIYKNGKSLMLSSLHVPVLFQKIDILMVLCAGLCVVSSFDVCWSRRSFCYVLGFVFHQELYIVACCK